MSESYGCKALAEERGKGRFCGEIKAGFPSKWKPRIPPQASEHLERADIDYQETPISTPTISIRDLLEKLPKY